MSIVSAFVVTAALISTSLSYAQDKGECTPGALVTPGDTCSVGVFHWRLEHETYAGRRVYGIADGAMKVSEPLQGDSVQDDAPGRCHDGYRLPSGYYGGREGAPPYLSDFELLDAAGIRKVVPTVGGELGDPERRFWSSTLNRMEPSPGVANVYDGIYGTINIRCRIEGCDEQLRSQRLGVLCVSGRYAKPKREPDPDSDSRISHN